MLPALEGHRAFIICVNHGILANWAPEVFVCSFKNRVMPDKKRAACMVASLMSAGLVCFTLATRAAEATRSAAAGDDADDVKAIERASRVGRKEGQRLLGEIWDSWRRQKREVPPTTGKAFARALAAVCGTPEAATAILGADAEKQLARQVFFRRHHEQWLLDRPLRLCLVFDWIKGQEPRLIAVHWLAGTE